MRLAKRISMLNPSFTMEMASKASEMRRVGKDVIDFSVGQPDNITFPHICKAAKKAIDKGFTKYTQVGGIPELKNAIQTKLKRDNYIDVDKNQILVSNGGKQGLYLSCQALFENGDEVLIFSPYWVSYPEMVKLADAKPLIAPTIPDKQYEPDFDKLNKLINNKIKGVIINSPSNPTGGVWSDDAIVKILRLSVKHNWVVLSDECYEHFVYNKTFKSVQYLNQIGAEVITFMTLSKSYAMTGWRVGYSFGSKNIIKAMSKLQGQETSCVNSIAQRAAIEALIGDQTPMLDMKKKFNSRRRLMIEALRGIPNIYIYEPKGAFYLFPDFSYFLGKTIDGFKIKSSIQLSNYFLDNSNVVTVPGDGFGEGNNVRFSYAVPSKLIVEGIDRIKKKLIELKRSKK